MIHVIRSVFHHNTRIVLICRPRSYNYFAYPEYDCLLCLFCMLNNYRIKYSTQGPKWNSSAILWYETEFPCDLDLLNHLFFCFFEVLLVILLLLFWNGVKFFESRWPSRGWSVRPIYQVASSHSENNILKQQSREKPNRSLPSDIDHAFVSPWPALITKVSSLGWENKE